MMSPLLEVHGLDGFYGRTRALSRCNFHVAQGGVTAMLGANGAGKTTALRAICGMVSRQGSVVFEGKRIDDAATDEIARLGIAHVPEGRGTLVGLTVEENLKVGAYRHSGNEKTKRNLDSVYTYFPRLKERRSQQAGTLSGGEQQMLALGRALMMSPKLLLLDEPSFGIAPLVVRELFKILRSINDAEGVGILLVEQNAALALDLADQVYLLETGRIVFEGSSDEIRNNDAIRSAYLGK